MKAKYYQIISLCLLWAAALCTACTDDAVSPFNPLLPEPDDGLPQVADGQFVVSYGTSEADTRALSTNPLPANERISSLHYFVYDDETKNLIKMRQIRGIDKSTHWPISSRDNKMPWELRQDLQDTLMAGPQYRILFIANIDSTLFTLPDGKPHPALFRNVENYTSAKILLPKVPFSDNNMYYLWEDTLLVESKTTIKRNDVKLQRLVTRTDVRRKTINLETHVDSVLEHTTYHAQETEIKKEMDVHLDEFCTAFDKMQGDYKDQAQQMKALLKKPDVRNKLYAAMKDSIMKDYTTNLAEAKYLQKMNEWTLARTVTVKYKENTRVNAMTFNRKPLHLADGVTDTEEVLPVAEGAFSIVSFLTDNITPNSKCTNKIESLSFTTEDPAQNFTIKNAIFQTGEEMNRWYDVICIPMDSVKIVSKKYYAPAQLSFDFTKILEEVPEWKDLYTFTLGGSKKPFIHWVNENVFGKNDEKFGTNFTNFHFSGNTVLLIPSAKDLKESDVMIVPSWKKVLH